MATDTRVEALLKEYPLGGLSDAERSALAKNA
jgi:hypothetical protein